MIDKEIQKQVVEIIRAHRKPEKIVLFGSRAIGNNTERSDYDIAIFDKNITGAEINLIKNALEEDIPVPVKFDVLNYYAITKESLKQNIVKEGKVLYES